MKILFFVNKFPCISETFVLNQICELIKIGHDVKIYSWGKPDKLIHEDFIKYKLDKRCFHLYHTIPNNKLLRIIKISPFILKSYIKNGIKTSFLFSKLYGKQAKNLLISYIADGYDKIGWVPETIISHFGDNGIIINALKKSGIVHRQTKCFTFIHAYEICKLNSKQIKQKYSPIFESDDILLPINKLWAQKFLDAGARQEQVKLFRMGIDSSKFIFDINKSWTNSKINILSVGRLTGQKGFKYAIEGVAKFIKKYNNFNVQYTIIGTGNLEKELKKLVETLGVQNHIIFLGAQPQEIVIDKLKKSDIFLLPSVTDEKGFMEGIPVALMEAMAIGSICISTYHSGIPELIKNEKNGFLCEEKNYNEICDVLLKIKNLSQEDFQSVRLNAKKTIEREFNLKKLMVELTSLLSASAN